MRTIRQQLTWKLLLAFSLPLVLGGIAVFLSTRAALLEEFDTALRTRALAIVTATEQKGDRVDVDVPESFMRESDEEDAPGFFQMWHTDGTAIKSSALAPASVMPSRFGTLDRPTFWNSTLPSQSASRVIGFKFTPSTSKKEPPSSAAREIILVVASDRHELDETLATLAFALLGCGAGLLALTVVVVPRLLRRELAPLDALAEQAGRIMLTRLPYAFPPLHCRVNSLPLVAA